MFLYRWEKRNSLVTVAVHVAMYAVDNKSAHKTSVYSRALKTKACVLSTSSTV